MLSATCGEQLLEPGVEKTPDTAGGRRGADVERPRLQGNGCVTPWTIRIVLHNQGEEKRERSRGFRDLSPTLTDPLPPPQDP